MIVVYLTPQEVVYLDRQNPATKSNGGFQNLLVTFQQKVNRTTGALVLTFTDLERIQRYAFAYRSGGWQGRLRNIFERTLGPTLGGQYLPRVA